MNVERNVLAVIPARGGSKGIPRKNMRLMHGRPLIDYAISCAAESSCITDVAVSTDSREILDFVEQIDGVVALERSPELSGDDITLDPVVNDAVVRVEALRGVRYDIVITMQPTSPLLTVRTLDTAIERFLNSDSDTMVSATNAPHLSWGKDGRNRFVPNYERRLNRQELPPNYVETGAFLVSKRSCIGPSSRIGDNVTVFEVPADEAVDIDTMQDWIVCEAMLSRRLIVFRVDGHKELGLGHVYRALTLGYELIEHDVVFVCNARHREGIAKLKSANMPVLEVEDDEEMLRWLEERRPDVFVYDCLDSDASLMADVKRYVKRLVTFEDLGEGARLADAVVNAIYEGASPHGNVYSGKGYVCLRDEFLITQPSEDSDEVRRILVTFGGTDPLDLTARVYELAKRHDAEAVDVTFDFVLGSGYDNPAVQSVPECGIEVSRNVLRMSDHMRKADMALSSQGRTTFELACMGVPTIVLAENEREQLHTFAQMDNGFINLGLGSEVSDEDLASTIAWLAGARSVRREMRKLMLENDLRLGIRRVKRIVLGDVL